MKLGTHPSKIISYVVTSCLLGAASITSLYADAEAPTLKINGYTVVNAMASNQQRKDNGKGGSDPYIGIGASDMYFTVTGKAANGMEYKYRINFETIPGSDAYINKNYVEVNGDFGTVQAGNVTGPDDTLPESGANLIGGANGIDGGMNSIYNYSAGVVKGVNFVGETKKASKAVFYSPEVMGFQLGLAITPNTSHRGDSSRNNARAGDTPKVGNSQGIYPNYGTVAPYGTRNITYGLTYKGSVDKWSYAFAAVGMTEKSHYADPSQFGGQKQIPINNANSYQLSASVGYDQWKVAAGWIDNGKSRLPKDNSLYYAKDGSTLLLGNTHLGNSGKAWNLGASYTVGAYQFAAVYHRTDRKTDATNKATSDIIATSVDLKALQGLKVFAEADFIKTRTNAGAKAVQQAYMDTQSKGEKAIGDNSGAVFILGTAVSF